MGRVRDLISLWMTILFAGVFPPPYLIHTMTPDVSVWIIRKNEHLLLLPHNLRLTAKYSFGKAILSLAESYASGRLFLQGKTPPYHSVDVNLTYLLSPKVIIYSSLNNILGRTNVFGYDAKGRPIVSSRDRFFYIGIFVSLKNNKAYDISNF